MRTRRTLRNLAAMLLAVVAASAVAASAASLNGIAAADLGSWTVPGGTGAPTVLTWADFDGANNTKLAGTTLNGGGTWTGQNGTWRSVSNQARSSRKARSNLTTPVGTTNAAVEAQLHPGKNPSAGLIALSDGTSYVWAELTKSSGGRISLYEYVGGTATQLAQVSGVGLPASAIMRLDVGTDTVAVSWNGAVVLTYALTASEIARFRSAGHDRFGLMANGDSATRFDDFHVDS